MALHMAHLIWNTDKRGCSFSPLFCFIIHGIWRLKWINDSEKRIHTHVQTQLMISRDNKVNHFHRIFIFFLGKALQIWISYLLQTYVVPLSIFPFDFLLPILSFFLCTSSSSHCNCVCVNMEDEPKTEKLNDKNPFSLKLLFEVEWTR